MNQNENPNAPDELHRSFYQADHGFFKGNSYVGDWKIVGDDSLPGQDPSADAVAAGYFNPLNNVTPFTTLGFNVAAGGLDFFGDDVQNVSLHGDVLVARNAGGGQDIVHVDLATGDVRVVVEGLPAALEVRRDPFGNFLAGGQGVVSLVRIDRIIHPDLNNDGAFNIADWVAFKAAYGSDTSALSPTLAYYAGDLNADGFVDLNDAGLFAREYDAVFGAGAFSAASAVPEPTAASLLAVAAAHMIAQSSWRRHKKMRR